MAPHRHNATTPFGRLPPELVRIVIEFATISAARAPIDGLGAANHLLRTLLSSCRIIRSSALRTPLAWSFIQYIYPDSHYDEDFAWRWLSQHLEMSGCLTFYLQIDLSRRHCRDIQSLKYLLGPHMNRCGSLEVLEPRFVAGGSSFFPLEGEMGNIQEVMLSCSTAGPCALLGNTFRGPGLRSLTYMFPLGSFPPMGPSLFSPTSIPKHLTRLELQLIDSPFSNILHYAASLPLLQHLRVLCLSHIAHDLETDTTLVFPNLQVLGIDVGFADVDNLREIVAPNLTDLQITSSKHIIDPFWRWSYFPNLIALQICGGPVLDYAMMDLICAHTSLRTLAIDLREISSEVAWKCLMYRFREDFPDLQVLQFTSYLDAPDALFVIGHLAYTLQMRWSTQCRWNQRVNPLFSRDLPLVIASLRGQVSQWEWDSAVQDILYDFFPISPCIV